MDNRPDKTMLVRGIGIRDIVLKIGITKVLKTSKPGKYEDKPLVSHYDCLETDEFWTYVKGTKHKIWLMYAYHRESGEIAVSNLRFAVWGKRDIKTARKLGKRRGISCDRIAADNRNSFIPIFADDAHRGGKEYTAGIEGNIVGICLKIITTHKNKL